MEAVEEGADRAVVVACVQVLACGICTAVQDRVRVGVGDGVGVVGEDRQGLVAAARRGARGELERGSGGGEVGLSGAEDDLDVAVVRVVDDFLQPGGDVSQVGCAEHESLLRALGRFAYPLAQDAGVGSEGFPAPVAR